MVKVYLDIFEDDEECYCDKEHLDENPDDYDALIDKIIELFGNNDYRLCKQFEKIRFDSLTIEVSQEFVDNYANKRIQIKPDNYTGRVWGKVEVYFELQNEEPNPTYTEILYPKNYLQYVENQSTELCLEVVKQNGLALKYVKEQTDEICLAAVQQNNKALQYVKDQTSKIREVALQYCLI
jgi:hypothetical protein